MSWLYNNPYLSPQTRADISTYGLGLSHGYDTLFRPYYSTYDPISYKHGLNKHMYNNPSYNLFGELDHYMKPMSQYTPPTRDVPIDTLEFEMNEFISKIDDPRSAYNSFGKPYSYYTSRYPVTGNYSASERLAEIGVGVGTFEDNRRTPYDLYNPSYDESLKPVDYQHILLDNDTKVASNRNKSIGGPQQGGGNTDRQSVSFNQRQQQDMQQMVSQGGGGQQPRGSIVPNQQQQQQQPRGSVVPNQQQQQQFQQQQQRGSVVPGQQQQNQNNQPRQSVAPNQQQRLSVVPNQGNPSKPAGQQQKPKRK